MAEPGGIYHEKTTCGSGLVRGIGLIIALVFLFLGNAAWVARHSTLAVTSIRNRYDADHPTYGRVEASQDIQPGYYCDSLVVLIMF